MIIRDDGKSIEVQIRTVLQQGWAELSEKFADIVDPSIKYGGGPSLVRQFLDDVAILGGEIEELEMDVLSTDSAERLRGLRENLVTLVRSTIERL